MTPNEAAAKIDELEKKVRALENDVLRIGRAPLIAEIQVTMQYMAEKIKYDPDFDDTAVLNEINNLVFKIQQQPKPKE